MFTIDATPSRAGSAFVINTTATGSSGANGVNLYRETNNDGNWVKIYSGSMGADPRVSGESHHQWFDTGEGLQVPLDNTATYAYKIEDASTVSDYAQTPSLACVSQIKIEQDIFTQELIKVFKSAISSLIIPENFSSSYIEVTHALPLTRTPKFPFITIYRDYSSQEEEGIGFLEPLPTDEPYTISTLQLRRFNIGIYTQTVEEREFLADAVVAIFYAIADSFIRLGWATTIRWQATQGQDEDSDDGVAPAYYYSQIMLDVTGNAATTITSITGVGPITEIDQKFTSNNVSPDESLYP